MTGPGRLALSALLVAAGLAGCGRSSLSKQDAQRISALREVRDDLHGRLEKAVSEDALAARAFRDPGRLIVAVPSRMIEKLTIDVARQYLNRVAIDLSALESQAKGKIDADTFFGRIKVGDWRIELVVERLLGRLEAGTASLRFRGGNMLDVDLPVQVKPASGRIAIRFYWDSASVVNLVCRDFELANELEGAVLPQEHTLSGSLRFAAEGTFVTVEPLFPERKIELKVDLAAASWATVEAALRSQDSLGRCGILLKPEDVVAKLRALAAAGIKVRLPDSMFRTVRLPAGLEQVVHVDQRVVDLSVTTETLRVGSETLWSSASVRLKDRARPSGVEPPTGAEGAAQPSGS